MKTYKNIESGERIHVSGWALVHRLTSEPVLSGQSVYSADALKNGHAVVTSGAPPAEDMPDGAIWCALLKDVMNPHRFGLRWVKLDSEGNPLL
jgi:hypothetical protein